MLFMTWGALTEKRQTTAELYKWPGTLLGAFSILYHVIGEL